MSTGNLAEKHKMLHVVLGFYKSRVSKSLKNRTRGCVPGLFDDLKNSLKKSVNLICYPDHDGALVKMLRVVYDISGVGQ